LVKLTLTSWILLSYTREFYFLDTSLRKNLKNLKPKMPAL